MRRVSAFAILFAAFTFTFSPIASAHTTLISSVPASDAELAEAPTTIELEFSEDLIALGKGTKVTVIAPSGKDISIGLPTVIKTHVSQPLNVDSTPGVYSVKFRVVATDGHVLEDTYAFTITSGQSATTSAAPIMKPTSPTGNEEEAVEGSGEEQDGSGKVIPALFVGVVVLAIYGVFRFLRREKE
jgi:methionine-rich copper-binding protein CopC